jgi:hypothetical protein
MGQYKHAGVCIADSLVAPSGFLKTLHACFIQSVLM